MSWMRGGGGEGGGGRRGRKPVNVLKFQKFFNPKLVLTFLSEEKATASKILFSIVTSLFTPFILVSLLIFSFLIQWEFEV